MNIVFFSNTLNHHQVALCDELYKICGERFWFVETSTLNDERRRMGFNNFDRPYKISSQEPLAYELSIGAEVAIMGGESFTFLKNRIERSDGITFSYSERWFKRGVINVFSPSIMRQWMLYLSHGRHRRWYMLCASGYLANDLKRLGIFRDRCFKWGYFPKYTHEDKWGRILNPPTKILWVARFLNWKHPELMLQLAKKLLADNIDFEIEMIGDGPERGFINSIIDSSTQLKRHISLLGNITNKQVVDKMAQSDIFCLTSDKREGWGVVLGESMSVGCCPVVSSTVGAAPFLVKNGTNGLVFKSEDANDLYNKIRFLIDNPNKRIGMGENAKDTIHNHWTAVTAAKNLVALSQSILDGQPTPAFIDEPCQPINNC